MVTLHVVVRVHTCKGLSGYIIAPSVSLVLQLVMHHCTLLHIRDLTRVVISYEIYEK